MDEHEDRQVNPHGSASPPELIVERRQVADSGCHMDSRRQWTARKLLIVAVLGSLLGACGGTGTTSGPAGSPGAEASIAADPAEDAARGEGSET
ncbi:MAG: hypothetical protein KY462_16095, partial [Actinobacteria bacterium]|nr:hypothetical protein [Actinomycetota bacterium]